MPNTSPAASPAAIASPPPPAARTASSPARRRRRKSAKPAGQVLAKPSPSVANLASSLETLHGEWRKSATAYRLQTDARFLELREALAGKSGTRLKLGGKEARRLAEAARSAKLKPKKGRLRDLRAVDEVLKDVLRRVDA